MDHACNPALYCRLCELAGRKTPKPGKPVGRAVSPAVPEPTPCIHRGEPVKASAISEAGFSPIREHFRCGSKLALGIVTECRTCTAVGVPKAPFCGPGCAGYTEPANIYRPVPTPKIVRNRSRCVVTLAVGSIGEELHALTGPSQRAYAERIGADFHVIAGKTQPDNPCFEKFRVKPYAEAYSGGTLYLDADVFVMADAPDILDATPAGSVGLVDIAPRMPGVLDFGRGQLEKLSRAIGKPIPAGAASVYWNSGVWAGRPEVAGYWTPPDFAIPDPHHCDEETWCRWQAFALAIPVHPLDRRFNWTWCEDRSFAQWEEARPWMVHLAGMGDYAGHPAEWQTPNSEWRKVLFRMLESLR
jgi:hypothetical protein